jgi:hypothetical protein
MAACLEQGSLSRATGSTNMNNQSRLIKHFASLLWTSQISFYSWNNYLFFRFLDYF